MVECTVDYVKTRRDAMSEKLKQAKKELESTVPVSAELTNVSKELAEIEKEYADVQEQIRIKSSSGDAPTEPEEKAQQVEIDTDPEIMRVKEMKNAQEIALYITSEFGEAIVLGKKGPSIEELRAKAIKLRTERIMES